MVSGYSSARRRVIGYSAEGIVEQRKIAGIVVVVISAVMVVLSVLVLSWRTMEKRGIEASLTLRSLEVCRKHKCRTYDYKYKEMKKRTQDELMYFGSLATFICGLLWTGLLVTCAIVAGTARTRAPLRGWGYATFGFGIFTTLVGIGTEIVMGIATTQESSVGAGFIVFLVGGSGGIVGALLCAGAQPGQPQMMASASSSPSAHFGYPQPTQPGPAAHYTPACVQCAAPAEYSQQYARWFCGSCRIYL